MVQEWNSQFAKAIELMPEVALTSFTVCDAYRYFVGQTLLLTSQNRSRAEYFTPTDNILVVCLVMC